MFRRALFLLVAIVAFAGFNSGVYAAESSISLSSTFSKPYYASNEKFLINLSITNQDVTPLKADVFFTLHSRLQLEAPLDNTNKVVFKYIWRRVSLKPGDKQLTLSRSISGLKLDQGAYPISITVISKGQPILQQTSMLVVVNEPTGEPSFPLAVMLLWNLHDRAHFDPQGVFVDDQIQLDCSRALENPGKYMDHSTMISQYPGIQVNMAVTPLLIEQIENISKGFKIRQDGKIKSFSPIASQSQDAREIISEYGELFRAGRVGLVPAPYAYSSLPFLANQKWDEDARLQIDLGRRTLARVFDLSLEKKNFWVPSLKLNSASIAYLSEKGVEQTVLDERLFETISSETDDGDIYQSYRIQGAGSSRLTALFRDNKTSQALEIKPPQSAVQIMLGRFAEIYLRQIDRQKVVAISPLVENWQPSKEFLGALYGALSQIPWLKTVTLEDAVALAPPPTKPLTMLDQEEEESYIKSRYHNKLVAARGDYQVFSNLTSEQNPLREELTHYLLIAESYDWTGFEEDPAVTNLGLEFIEKMSQTVSGELSKIKITSRGKVTLPSATGKIPVAIKNGTNYSAKVTVQISGKDFLFPSGQIQKVNLKPKENLFTFPLEATNSESSPLKIVVKSGDRIIDQTTIEVNPTFFNRVVFFIAVLLILAVSIFIFAKWLRARMKKTR